VIYGELDPATWGNAAEGVAALGAAGALIATYLLLRHEILLRKDAEQAHQRTLARRLLEIVREVLDRWPHDDATAPKRCAQLARDIRLYAFELTDADLQNRVRTTEMVAFTLGSDDEAFARSSSPTRPMTRAFAIVRFRGLLATTTYSLEEYITNGTLPPWPDDLPEESARAQAWIWTAPE
jgi:hypothetical protein